MPSHPACDEPTAPPAVDTSERCKQFTLTQRTYDAATPLVHTMTAPVTVSMAATDTFQGDVSPKKRVVAALLCFYLGSFGAHRFYVGKPGTALLMFLTLGGLGCWSLIDFVLILFGKFTDRYDRLLLD